MAKQFTMEDIKILHEDNSVLVVVKPQNIPSQADSSGDTDLLTLLKGYIKEKYNKPGDVYLGLVHRLDRPTGGVMVFARNSKSADRLSKQIRQGDVTKKYLVVANNVPKFPTDTLVNYLKKNPLLNTVSVVNFATAGAKEARLSYRVLDRFATGNVSVKMLSLLEVQLDTGRSHQIRVQLGSINCPVFGDVKYGGDILAKGHNLALWAYYLSFEHPVTKTNMVFVANPPEIEPWTRFDPSIHTDVFKPTENYVDVNIDLD